MSSRPTFLLFSAAVGCALCAVGCDLHGTGRAPVADRAGPAQRTGPQPSGPPRRTGGCENLDVQGTCELLVITPAPTASDRGPAGTSLFRVIHNVTANGETYELISMHLRAPTERQSELEHYYRSRGRTPCRAHIVRPPCNPQGTTVQLGFPPPDFARPERF